MKNVCLKYILGILFVSLTIWLGYFVTQSDFVPLITGFSLFFLAYLYVCQSLILSKKDIYFFIGLGILLRLILLFSLPNLSDDLYRFIWDGRLIINGINPFDQLPSYYIEKGIVIQGINQELYQLLNSPNYFTIYPPVCQGIFATAVWLAPNSIQGSSLIIKLFFLFFEIGSIYLLIQLLKHFELKLRNVLWYVLNPLIVLELIGNIHFEAAMIFFLLLAIWFLVKDQWYLSSVFMAFSIASKLLPLMFLPFLIRRLGWKKCFQYFTLMGVMLLLLFSPILSDVFFTNIGNSLSLYFQKFEFNGSLYYLLRWIGFQVYGYNLIAGIGPGLALIVFVSIWILAFREKQIQIKFLFSMLLFSLTLFLFCTTTIMPWYISTLIAICIFTPFRYPILWSGLIFLTYINYSYNPYYENLWLVGLEYILVSAFMFFELRKWGIISKQAYTK